MATQQEVRDTAIRLRSFTLDGLSRSLNLPDDETKEHLEWLIKKGIIVDLGPVRVGIPGRPRVYCWADPKIFIQKEWKEVTVREKQKPPESIVRHHRVEHPRGPVEGTSSKRRKVHPDIQALIDEAVEMGWTADLRPAHPVLIAPDGRRVTCSATPSDHRTVKNLRALVNSIERSMEEAS